MKDRRRRRHAAGAAGVLVLLGGASGCEPPAAERAEDPVRVRITGKDFEWHIVFAAGDGAFETADDRVTRQHLHLPSRARVLLEVCSDDYLYSFLLPGLDIVEAAIPRLPVEMELRTGDPARMELRGSQMCGFSHPNLIGEVVVEEPGKFLSWRGSLGGGP